VTTRLSRFPAEPGGWGWVEEFAITVSKALAAEGASVVVNHASSKADADSVGRDGRYAQRIPLGLLVNNSSPPAAYADTYLI
jgi:hypothetical protein